MNVPSQNRREREKRKEEQEEREIRKEAQEERERSQLNTLIAVPNPTAEQYSMIDSLRVKLGHKPAGLMCSTFTNLTVCSYKILFCSNLFIPFYIPPTLFDLL